MQDPAQTIIAYGLVTLLFLLIGSITIGWLGDRRRRVMSKSASGEHAADGVAIAATTTLQPATIDRNAVEPSNELLLRNQARALAKLVKAGKVGETEGLQIVFGVRPSSTNVRYIEVRAMLKAELAHLDGQSTPIAGRTTAAKFASDPS